MAVEDETVNRDADTTAEPEAGTMGELEAEGLVNP